MSNKAGGKANGNRPKAGDTSSTLSSPLDLGIAVSIYRRDAQGNLLELTQDKAIRSTEDERLFRLPGWPTEQ